MTTTREQAFEAVAALNAKIADLKCAATINGAKYGHEIDKSYGRIDCVADCIKVLAKQVHWLRNEARSVNIPDGSYAWAVKLCEQATSLVGLIDNIERRA